MINNLPTIMKKKGEADRMKSHLHTAGRSDFILDFSIDDMIVAIHGVVMNSPEAGSCFLSLGHSVNLPTIHANLLPVTG